MTDTEAKSRAIKETNYCYVLAQAKIDYANNNSIYLERIFTKGGCEEIRLAWWSGGKLAPRPADIDAVDWVALFTDAVRNGVFTAEEQLDMIKTLI